MYMAYSPAFHYDTGKGKYVGGQSDDGRAATLKEQVKGPFVNSVAMGNASRSAVVDRLNAGPNAAAFLAVYGANALEDVESAYGNLADDDRRFWPDWRCVVIPSTSRALQRLKRSLALRRPLTQCARGLGWSSYE